MIAYLSYIACACIAIFWIIKALWERYLDRLKLFKSPPSDPLFGHSLKFPRDPAEILLVIKNWLLQYEYEVLLYLGPHRMFLSGNPDHAEILLNNTKTISKSYEYSFLEPWLGTGLLLSDGSKWKTRRRLLTPAFHYGILDDFAEVFQEQADIFVKKLKPLADSGDKFNICPDVTNCTLDVICETAMGVNCGAQTDSESAYPSAVLSISALIQKRQLSPLIWPDIIYGMTANGRKHNTAVKLLHEFTFKVIKDKVKARNSKQDPRVKKRLSFIDILMESYEVGEIDIEGLREEVDTFMFEGHDTTAAGIFWTLYLLGRHPEALKKVQEEVDRVYENKGSKTPVELTKDCQYLTCVIKESLRLYPSVPLFARGLKEDLDLGKGLVLPRGSSFGIATFMVHRNPLFWDDPDDFKPERFLPENINKRHPYAYIPFSAGPRNCIGQKFALLEEKVIIATFLRQYNVTSFEHPDDLEVCAEIILRTKNGLMVQISNR